MRGTTVLTTIDTTNRVICGWVLLDRKGHNSLIFHALLCTIVRCCISAIVFKSLTLRHTPKSLFIRLRGFLMLLEKQRFFQEKRQIVKFAFEQESCWRVVSFTEGRGVAQGCRRAPFFLRTASQRKERTGPHRGNGSCLSSFAHDGSSILKRFQV